MSLIRNARAKFQDFLFDSSIDLRDRCFIVFSVVLVISFLGSVPCGIIMREPVLSTVMTLLASIVISVLVRIGYVTRKIKPIRQTIAVLAVLFLLPGLLMTNGGVLSGAPLWVLLGFYYVVMITDGRFRKILGVLTFFILLGLWILEYRHPGLMTEYTRWGNYFDSYTALITALLVIAFNVNFQTRLYERENRIAREKARQFEELNRAQNRFFSSMSHEIRTPINTVLGLNEVILRQKDATEEIRKDARNIQSAGRLLLTLINDILDLSKMEAGKMEIVPVDYKLSSLLSEIVNMIWLKAQEKGLKFRVDVDPEVPETLFGDEVRIRQILINLLNNAVKYTAEGEVALHVESELKENGIALLKINVSDTGTGIKPEAIPYLFDTFKRVDEEKNRHIEGTGLGLSIVKQLVELMDGKVTVNSVYGQGSTFTVELKQGVSSDKKIGALDITGEGGLTDNESFEHSFRAPDARVLIVDDNEMNMEVEKKLLDGTMMSIDLSASGRDALAKTMDNRYDVIFLDHLMPEMDGIECYKAIRLQMGGMNNRTPIIVLTANAGSENAELYNDTGFDGYLLKPVSARQLEDVLIRFLPADKVHGSIHSQAASSFINTASGYVRKKPVVVATSTMSDLPKYVLKKMDIHVIPYRLVTDEGVFLDNVDLNSEELVQYMKDESRTVTSEPPTEDALVAFFSRELRRAHHLIYVTILRGSSREYGRAVNAAKSFDNVTVINSECLSSATGIFVMIAAKLAEQNLSPDRIIAELGEVKKHISCSFVIKTTDAMMRRQRISPFMNSLLNLFWLRPMLLTKNDSLSVGGMFRGTPRRCYEKYLKNAFPRGTSVDTSFVFVTYAGMDEEELLYIEDELKRIKKFDHVIFQKASAGITSNCGEGTFGLLYMTKSGRDYNLGALFDRDDDDADISEIDGDEVLAEEPEAVSKWYENLPGIDGAEAIKNSGSEEAFSTVLKIFYDSIASKAGEIEELYTVRDWKNYTIKVHALKSSAKLIGAIKLSEGAWKLETAGKEGNIDYIRENHGTFMKDFTDYKEVLAALFPQNTSVSSGEWIKEKPAADDKLLTSVYNELKEAAEEMDCDAIEEILKSLDGYAIPETEKERVDAIRLRADNFDYEGVIKAISDRIVL